MRNAHYDLTVNKMLTFVEIIGMVPVGWLFVMDSIDSSLVLMPGLLDVSELIFIKSTSLRLIRKKRVFSYNITFWCNDSTDIFIHS